MKSLYSKKDYLLTDEAKNLDDRMYITLEELFAQYIEMGYSPIEISHLIIEDAIELELAAITDKIYNDRKNETDNV
jgi:hypothetical protein